MLTQSIGLYLAVISFYSAVLFSIAHCVFLIAFTLDLKNEFHILNENFRLENGGKKKMSKDRQFELREQFGKIIQFQCDAKQLSE